MQTGRRHIAVDAMGGDLAPAAIVSGAIEAVTLSEKPFGVILVGDRERIASELAKHPSTDRVSVQHASQVIEMDEPATTGLRSKRDSSIVRGIELHRDGAAHGFVSAGNSGAVMAASTLTLGRIQNVSRPTIGTFIPNAESVTLVLDAGANVDCKPKHLLEFAVMGSVYVEEMLQKNRPRVGLLNIGEEEGKGNEVALETYALLKNSPLNFIGNIEGSDVLAGTCDVAVCDGFVGNIVLKFAEGVLTLLKAKFRRYAETNVLKKVWMGMISGSIRKSLKDMDYQEYGGVPLLGVNGVTLIGHGKSTPKAIRNMILKADEMIERNINARIQDSLTQLL